MLSESHVMSRPECSDKVIEERAIAYSESEVRRWIKELSRTSGYAGALQHLCSFSDAGPNHGNRD